MGTDTKRSWKKRAALALAIFAALAGTFKLGHHPLATTHLDELAGFRNSLS